MTTFSKLTCLAAVTLWSGAASAATMDFDVLSTQVATGSALDTGIVLSVGDEFSISAAVDDYWSLGAGLNRSINADGDSEGTGAPVFGSYTDSASGQSFIFGQLIGRIGTGDYFLIGTDFMGTADTAGTLFLGSWDSGIRDNSGSILATVVYQNTAAVPLPASLPMLLAGLAGIGAVRRRK